LCLLFIFINDIIKRYHFDYFLNFSKIVDICLFSFNKVLFLG